MTMRAMCIHQFGGPDVMRLENVPRPAAAEGERLVRLAAASVNPIDWKMREGLLGGSFPRILGRDGAGVDVASGERVMGIGGFGRDGTHAEYCVFSREASVEVPEDLSFESAAALGIAGLSAWIPIVENALVAKGQRVLIHGGAGGVGCFAIQIAALQGAEVWTTCSARNSDWCRSLGASRTIDYRREDFAAAGPIFDAVLDTIGGEVHARSAQVLKPGGALVFLNAAPRAPVHRTDVRVLPTEVRATPERLRALLSARLRVPIEAQFPLERAAEGYELSRSGHARGKIVIQIA